MANEKVTENIVRKILKDRGYQNDVFLVTEQESEIAGIKRCLKSAGKAGNGGVGRPEFIITNSEEFDYVVVIECKKNIKDHESKEGRQDPEKHAVDGVLHYAKALSSSYNVIAIAVSGVRKNNLRVSNFIHFKDADSAIPLSTEARKPVEEIIGWSDYIRLANFNPELKKTFSERLTKFSAKLHDFLRDHAKLTESEKPLLVSGTLIALRDNVFNNAYRVCDIDELQGLWMRAIKKEFGKADMPAKKNNITQPYSSIAVHPNLGKTKSYPEGVLREIITVLHKEVWPYINHQGNYDIVGQFYGEFLKYTGGDKRALGIVLTPKHITELFSLLGNLHKSSKVLDICAGTGGFLISAMHNMTTKTSTDQEVVKIKNECLIGVENLPHMYALAASNMILRGDGKANLYQGSCFDNAITDDIVKRKCDVGMLNPPYAQGDEDLHELEFIRHMLHCLKKGGTGIAIVPMSSAISPHDLKSELLNEHTLVAVMSMPTELFQPVGVVSCIMIFTAKVPHEQSDKETWFGYWKNDGFVKTKTLGRYDLNRRWEEIRDGWVDNYRNGRVIPGHSVKMKVGPEDEWCVEAYMETDYSTITRNDFEETVKNYMLFKLKNGVS